MRAYEGSGAAADLITLTVNQPGFRDEHPAPATHPAPFGHDSPPRTGFVK